MNKIQLSSIFGIILVVFLVLISVVKPAKADDTVNSNNTNISNVDQDIKTNVGNTSNWSNSNTGSYNTHSDGNNRNNWSNSNTGSYNQDYSQRNTTSQSIDNSYTNKANSSINDSNIGANAGGKIDNTSSATGGTSSATSGDSSATGGNANQNQGQQQKQGQFTQTGAVNVAPVYQSNYHQVRQTPMAWSPNMAMSASQENCNNSASLGVSAGFGAVSGGVPINDNDCTRRRDAILWANLGQMRIACERMVQDSDNASAMKAAGTNCSTLTSLAIAPAVTVPSALNVPSSEYWDKLDRIANHQVYQMYKQRMLK